MTSSHHGPYGQGYTRTTMVGTEGCKPATVSQSQKPYLSPDWSLQLDSMKSESLVIADQHCCGEYVPGPCTHRPSHHGSLAPEAGSLTFGRALATVWPMTGVKS